MSAPTANISSAELRQRLGDSAPPRILDVRTPGEYETAHIAGSHNVPLDVVQKHHRDLTPHLRDDVVFVCRTGQRAGQARDILAGGRVLDRGLLDWEANGFDVDRGLQRWELERQVRLVAGSVVLTSVVGSVAVPRLKWVAAAIGAGLTYAALSDTCAMATVLARLPYNRGTAPDVDTIVARLAR